MNYNNLINNIKSDIDSDIESYNNSQNSEFSYNNKKEYDNNS